VGSGHYYKPTANDREGSPEKDRRHFSVDRGPPGSEASAMRNGCTLLGSSFPVLIILLAGCGHDHPPGAGSDVNEYFYDCEDPKRPANLRVFATDESLIALLNKESAGALKVREEEAAHLTEPTVGFSAATPPNFVIQPPVVGAQAAPDGLTPAPAAPPRRSLWRRALAWLAPVATAHAHCMPVTGDNYLLRLMKDGESKPAYAALASVTNFTPTATVWQAAMKGRTGQTLKLTLIRAGYSAGTVTTGPFVGTGTVTFTVAP
jgi:hypothetical protein